MSEIKALNKWRDVPCSWIGRLNIVRISFHSILKNIVNTIPANYFIDINKLLMCIWQSKRHRIGNTVLKEKNKIGRLTPTNYKTYCKATVIKAGWYWQKKRQIDIWNRIESPEMDPHNSQLTFDKGAKPIQWCKNSLFNKQCWNNWTSIWEKKKIQTQTFQSSQKINSKWAIDLKCRSVKLLADNVGENLKDLGYDNDFRYSNKGMVPERNNW